MERRQQLDALNIDFSSFDDEDRQFVFDADPDEYEAFIELQGLGGGLVQKMGG
jgi:hypothetical protein